MECAFWSWGLHGGNGAFKAFILTAFFSVWILGTSSAQISSVTPFPKDSRTGSTVLLSVQVTGNIRSFAWYRGTDTANQILSYIPGTTPPQETFPPYTGRVMGFPNGSMEITNLTPGDSGNYTVIIQFPSPTGTRSARVEINVYGTNPTQPGSSNGLSGGAIAGIVVGVLAFSAVVAGLVYYFVFMKPATGPSTSVPMQSTPTEQKNTEALPNTKANGNAEEIQYSSVNFVPKAAPPVKPTNENTVYSEVRR